MNKIDIIKTKYEYTHPITHNGVLYGSVEQPKGERGCLNCAFYYADGSGDQTISSVDRREICNKVWGEICYIKKINGIDYQSQYKRLK